MQGARPVAALPLPRLGPLPPAQGNIPDPSVLPGNLPVQGPPMPPGIAPVQGPPIPSGLLAEAGPGMGRKPEVLTPVGGQPDERLTGMPPAKVDTTAVKPPAQESALSKTLGDEKQMNALAGGLGKIAGGLGGGKTKGSLDLSTPGISNYDPSAQARAGAAQLFSSILAGRKKPGPNYGAMGLPPPTGMLGR